MCRVRGLEREGNVYDSTCYDATDMGYLDCCYVIEHVMIEIWNILEISSWECDSLSARKDRSQLSELR